MSSQQSREANTRPALDRPDTSGGGVWPPHYRPWASFKQQSTGRCGVGGGVGFLKTNLEGTSLVVQWLRLHTPQCRGPRGQGTRSLMQQWRSHVPQLRAGTVPSNSKKKKKKTTDLELMSFQLAASSPTPWGPPALHHHQAHPLVLDSPTAGGFQDQDLFADSTGLQPGHCSWPDVPTCHSHRFSTPTHPCQFCSFPFCSASAGFLSVIALKLGLPLDSSFLLHLQRVTNWLSTPWRGGYAHLLSLLDVSVAASWVSIPLGGLPFPLCFLPHSSWPGHHDQG